jgi:hypothetical protein
MAKNTGWKKGRGKLGVLAPLMGSWTADDNSPRGRVKCTRVFEPILEAKFIRLTAHWHFADSVYEEQAVFGFENDVLSFWSFTSDGKNSKGALADGTDVDPEAICFEAQMPAGLARMIYWPHPEGGFNWAVESKSKKGWNRMVHHHYTTADGQ